MHYSVIIISDKSFNFENTLCINEHIEFIDDCHILYKEETISFDYLIYTDYSLVSKQKEIGILTENKIPITNYEKQTLIENIFYCSSNEVDEVINNL